MIKNFAILFLLLLAGCATRVVYTPSTPSTPAWWQPEPNNVITVTTVSPIVVIEEGVVRATLAPGEVFVERMWTSLDADELTLVARRPDGQLLSKTFQLQRYGRKAHVWEVE